MPQKRVKLLHTTAQWVIKFTISGLNTTKFAHKWTNSAVIKVNPPD